MLDLLKNLAAQKLNEVMSNNSLNNEATNEAAQEGTSALLAGLIEKVKGGNLGDITELFSNEGRATQDNPLTQNLMGKLTEILQSKGMSAEEAQAEARNTAPNVMDTLKEKFLSQNEADKGFDLNDLSGLLGGDAGDLLNKVKGLL